MDFLYNVFLRLLQPIFLCLILLLIAFAFRKKRVGQISFWLALVVLMVCGNQWVVEGLARRLEWRYLPANTVPLADCIVVLSGGILSRVPPRPTIELGDGGDRVIYGAFLYRAGKAPVVICTGDAATGDVRVRPESEDMAELLESLGVPKEAIVTETKAKNTHEHATQLYPVLREKGFKRILLVTSALHMPRSMGVFKKLCPGILFVAAPTDFRVAEPVAAPWYHGLTGLIPTPDHLSQFTYVLHEYLGITYYKLRGWM